MDAVNGGTSVQVSGRGISEGSYESQKESGAIGRVCAAARERGLSSIEKADKSP